ncbi:ABC transporter ATP-binding protein [Gorillibacterium sp. sgz500922]|uniref:ABC transporter ATP-binding protein n=1 Tax=Gorillibacterium sp. sgz500922 TaxID=3446694 RepID=UPI003F677B0D
MASLVKRYLKGMAVLFACLAPLAMFGEVFMDLLQPKLLADMIDIGVAQRDLAYVFATGKKMILIALLGFVGGAACSVFASIASTDMGTKLRQGLFDKIQSFSFLELDRFQTSPLITRLSNDVMQVQSMLVMVLRGAVRSPLLCIGGIIMAVASSPRLSVVFLLAIPVILLVTVVILRRSYPLFAGVQNRIDRINTVMRESILGIRVIKSLTLENSQRSKFDEANGDLMAQSIRAQNMNMLLWPVVTLVMNLSVVGVLWFGGNMVASGSLEIGKIMAFINYLIQIMNSLIMMVSLVLSFSRAKASADRIQEVLETEPALREDAAAEPVRNWDIEFRNVSFRYHGHGEDVLSRISIKIEEGEKVGVIGSTGSGKSTLVQLIPRLYDVTEGQVRIGGTDVRKLRQSELRENIGLVLQDSILFSGTIEENLRYGDGSAGAEALTAAARQAQALAFIEEKEERFAGVVEQRGKNFSGGQKQRLSIARTLLKHPRILILDDSTSALDVATESRLLQSVMETMRGRTVIMIAQRISAVMDADKILVMENGTVTAAGTHRQLLQESETYRTIAVSQLGEEVLVHG